MLTDLWRKWREPKPFNEGYLPASWQPQGFLP